MEKYTEDDIKKINIYTEIQGNAGRYVVDVLFKDGKALSSLQIHEINSLSEITDFIRAQLETM